MNPICTANRQSEHGNIFVYIFLGITLFAALVYAVSKTSMNANSVSDQKTRLAATEVINYGSQLREAMTKLKLRGCQDDKFDFTNSVYLRVNNTALNGGNTNSPADNSCDLFQSSGGGILPYLIPEPYKDEVETCATCSKPGHGGVRVTQIKNIGTDAAAGTASANDLVMYLNRFKLPLCLKINELLGVRNNGSSPPTGLNVGTGEYVNGSLSGTTVINNSALAGKTAFCISFTDCAPNCPNYTFIQVLVPR